MFIFVKSLTFSFLGTFSFFLLFSTSENYNILTGSFSGWSKTGWEVTCREFVIGLRVSAQRCSSCLQYVCHRAAIRRWRPKRFLLYLKTSAPIQPLSSSAEGFVLHYIRTIYIRVVEIYLCTHALNNNWLVLLQSWWFFFCLSEINKYVNTVTI